MADETTSDPGTVTRHGAASAAGTTLRRIMDLAIDGAEGLPGAKSVAAKHLQKHPQTEEAIDSLIVTHTAMAGAQGFLANVGGLITTAISMPINLVGLAIVEARMVAAIAHLHGYDIDDVRVRTAVTMCLLGGEEMSKLVARNKLPGSPLLVATAPMVSADLGQQVAERVVAALVTINGSKGVGVLATKRIPIIGGGIGAVFDSVMTRQIGQYARRELVQRRAIR